MKLIKIDNMQIETGISTASLFPMLTEDALVHLLNLGFSNFEIFANSDCELTNDFGNKIFNILIENNAKAVSVHPYTSELETTFFFSDYRRRFEDGIKYYRKYFLYAQRIGARYVILHGPRISSTLSPRHIQERLNILGEISAEYNIEILLENVDRCRSKSPELLQVLAQGDTKYGFVLDVKQAYRSGYDLSYYIDVMGSKLKHIHASDHDSNRECLPIGYGRIDYGYLIYILKKNHFSGTVAIELYGEGITDQQLINSKKALDDAIRMNMEE